MKKYATLAAVLLLCMGILTGCGEKKDPMAKIKDLEFTVAVQENIPEELFPWLRRKRHRALR